MANQPAMVPTDALSHSSKVIRALVQPLLDHHMTAIACLLLVFIASYAAGFARTMAVTRTLPTAAGSPIHSYAAQPDYTQEYVPEKRSGGEAVASTRVRLAMYYEIPMLIVSLAIGIGALICRGPARRPDVSSYAPKTVENRRPQIFQIR